MLPVAECYFKFKCCICNLCPMNSNILIINSAEPGISEFYLSIEEVLKPLNTRFKSIEYKESQNIDFNHWDGIIITGSPKGDDIVAHHLPYFQWIPACGKPVLGICAGHHITGVLYGAKLLRNREPESGDSEVGIINEDPILDGIDSPFKVKQMHNDSITLPGGFIQLATSHVCKNQLMKHKSKPVYTCQFHPEFYNADIFRNFIRIVNNSQDSVK